MNNKKLTQECFTTYLPAFTKNIEGPFLDIGTEEAKLLTSLLIDGTNMATTVKKSATDSLKEYRTKFDEQTFEKLVSVVTPDEAKTK